MNLGQQSGYGFNRFENQMWLISGAYGSPSASAASFQKIRDVGGTSLVDYQFADNFASGLVQDGHLIPAEGAINVLVMPVEPMQDFCEPLELERNYAG